MNPMAKVTVYLSHVGIVGIKGIAQIMGIGVRGHCVY